MCDGRHPNCARDGRANLASPLGTAGTDTECTLSHSTAVSNCPKTGVMATVSALNVVISFDPKSNNLFGPKSAKALQLLSLKGNGRLFIVDRSKRKVLKVRSIHRMDSLNTLPEVEFVHAVSAGSSVKFLPAV